MEIRQAFRGGLYDSRIRPLLTATLIILPFIIITALFYRQLSISHRQDQLDDFYDSQRQYAQVLSVAVDSLYQSLYSDLLMLENADNMRVFLDDPQKGREGLQEFFSRIQESKPYLFDI
jgi:hypothetical protein